MRLRPYTTILPKPLLPVGDRPILEIILRQLAAAGFTKVDLCVGHLGELIRVYFTDGTIMPGRARARLALGARGAARDGRRAARRARARRHVPGHERRHPHDARLRRARRSTTSKSGAALTIAVQGKRVEIDLGVIELDGHRVTGYREKPTLSYDVSMGIYVYEARVLEHLPDGPCQFPELVQRLLDGRRGRVRLPLRRGLVRPRDDQRVRAGGGRARTPRQRAGLTRALITGDHRSGRLLSRRAAARARLRGPRARPRRGLARRLERRSRCTRGDLRDQASLRRALAAARPDEVYNLAAVSSVAVSWKDPVAHRRGHRPRRRAAARGGARDVPGGAAVPRVVERDLRAAPGGVADETTPIAPRRPTAPPRPTPTTSWSGYRRAYGLFCCYGILFNHESPRRGEEFVVRKITRGAAAIKLGLARTSCGSAPSTRGATGASRPTTSTRCRLMLQRERAERLRARHRASRTRSATASRSPSSTSASTGAST